MIVRAKIPLTGILYRGAPGVSMHVPGRNRHIFLDRVDRFERRLDRKSKDRGHKDDGNNPALSRMDHLQRKYHDLGVRSDVGDSTRR